MKILLLLIPTVIACENTSQTEAKSTALASDSLVVDSPVVVGAERMSAYLPLLEDQHVGLLVNHTSLVNEVHLVDTLLSRGIHIDKIFSPEHGFRGTADAGAVVSSSTDAATGVSIVSLYGANKKPKSSDLADLDVVVFDIQDVGVRFYTYISTMTYMMEACARDSVMLVILDRPNPNGHYVDGPVLDPECSSFIGLHEVPVVHGMTVGEYALMINKEKDIHCDLSVVECQNYDHNTFYDLPVKPSPNLPNMHAVYLYPSLGLFEMTIMSVGRGTDKQFQVFGHPEYSFGQFSFTPQDKPGANNPKYEGSECIGHDLSQTPLEVLRQMKSVSPSWLMEAHAQFGTDLFLDNYCILSGNREFQRQIEVGSTEEEMREGWRQDLIAFKEVRKRYLLYPDFE